MRQTARQHRFETLVAALSDDLYRYAYWLCGDATLAGDLVQETMLRAWRFLDNLREAKSAKAWLITTLRREHARLYERKQLDYAEVEQDDLPDSTSDPVTTTLERQSLREAIAQLPATYREPLALQVVWGYSVAEIAELMDLSVGAVTSRLFRARNLLIREFAPDAAAQGRMSGGRS